MTRGPKRFENTEELAQLAGLKDATKIEPFYALNQEVLYSNLLGAQKRIQVDPNSAVQLPGFNRTFNPQTVLVQLDNLKVVSPINSPEKPVAATSTQPSSATPRKLF